MTTLIKKTQRVVKWTLKYIIAFILTVLYAILSTYILPKYGIVIPDYFIGMGVCMIFIFTPLFFTNANKNNQQCTS